MSDGQKERKLRDVWRTCNKIRAAIFRIGLNLWEYFKPLDPQEKCLISESKFVSVFAGPLRAAIGLSEQEIGDLADYFRVQDGRIFYTQLCEVVQDSVPDFGKNKPLITGLEWEDPLHVNRLSLTELRRLNLIITHIAITLNKRNLILRPYFQDYELIANNFGSVTFTHFAQVFKFLAITIAADEFCLLVKRFAKNGYMVNYVAFLQAIEEVHKFMDERGMLDLGGDMLNQFPGRIITAELPKLPRPEIGKVVPSEVFGRQSVFHPVMDIHKESMPLEEVIQRIQRHVFERRIRVYDFFVDFDNLNSGRVTVSQFKRGLDTIQGSSLGYLYLTEDEIDELTAFYKDPNDPDRVCWRTFEDDIDHVFTMKEFEKLPNLQIDSPPREIAELPRKGRKKWQCVEKSMRELCEDTLQKVRNRVNERRIFLRQFFKDYDKHNNGHVSRPQMRQVFTTAAVLLSREERFALEQRYNDDLGFNYFQFIEELESPPIVPSLYNTILEGMKKLNADKALQEPTQDETNIVIIIAKIKAKVVRERIKVSQFFRPFDVHNEQVISRFNFIRGIEQMRCNLSCAEIQTIMDVFKSPLRLGFVDYVRFAATVEEAVAVGSLEKAPLLVPVQHVPSESCNKNFLNFDERILLAKGIDLLSAVREHNLEELFSDYDKENVGTVSKEKLLKALSVRKMLNITSHNEFEAIYKGFSVERFGRMEFNYRAFLQALHMLSENKKRLPF